MSEAVIIPDADPNGRQKDPHAMLRPQRSFAQMVIDDVVVRRGAQAGLLWVFVLAVAAVFAPLIVNSHPLVMKKAGVLSSPALTHLTLADVLLQVSFFALLFILPWRRVAMSARLLAVLSIILLVTAAGVMRPTFLPFVSDGWAKLTAEYAAYQQDQAGATTGSVISETLYYTAGWASLLLLLGAAIFFAVGLWRHTRAGMTFKLLVLAAIVAASALLIVRPINPPTNVVYDQYRTAMRDGDIEWVIRAPVGFSPSDRLRDQPQMRLAAPSATHIMGVTANGADLFSNMVYGARIALSIGFIATGIGLTLGIIIGGLMGYYAGVVDLLGMRLVEIFSAIPTLLLLLAFVAFFNVNLFVMMAIIGLTSWVGYAIYIRAEFLRLRNQDFVKAAQAAGLPLRSILFRHMLPNGVAPLLVAASFGVASAILVESTLSFLGIGLVEESSWGKLLNQARGVGGAFYWWIAVYPGLAIFLTVFAYNLVGEALRDAIDPHTKRHAT